MLGLYLSFLSVIGGLIRCSNSHARGFGYAVPMVFGEIVGFGVVTTGAYDSYQPTIVVRRRSVLLRDKLDRDLTA